MNLRQINIVLLPCLLRQRWANPKKTLDIGRGDLSQPLRRPSLEEETFLQGEQKTSILN